MSEKTDKIINKITEIRSKNNLNWMGILKLALQYVPWSELRPYISNIENCDKQIGNLTEELLK